MQGASLSITSSMDMQGIRLSITSNLDVQGVCLSTVSSVDMQAVPLKTFIQFFEMPECQTFRERSFTELKKNADVGTSPVLDEGSPVWHLNA
jgi:hypothetical protein